MTELNDTQIILLNAAAQRASLSLYPVPKTIRSAPRAIAAVTELIGAQLAEEREVDEPTLISRTEGDVRYGVFATSAGLAAIGVSADPEIVMVDAAPLIPPPASAPRLTKSATVLSLLQREQGATLPELIAATGWLPHTTRAALTGLRKKGHAIAKSKRDTATCYRVAVIA